MTVGIALIIGAIDVGPVPRAGFVVVPVGSATLMSDLARAGIARRAAIAQLLVVAIGLAIGLALPGSSLGPTASGVVLFAYLLSWVGVGVSLIRGVPQAKATSA